METANPLDALKGLPPETFVGLVELATWAADGCDRFAMDLAYQDDDLMVFKRRKPLSEAVKEPR